MEKKKAAPKPKKAMGRPSGFNERLAEEIYALAREGKTDEQIAQSIGVTARTLYIWKNRHPDFFQALKENKQVGDELVEASLFRRAMGYTHIEEKVFLYEGEIVTHLVEKHYPPDTTAAIFWLKNRQPERWRDKQEIEHSGKDGGPIKLQEVSDEDLNKELEHLRALDDKRRKAQASRA